MNTKRITPVVGMGDISSRAPIEEAIAFLLKLQGTGVKEIVVTAEAGGNINASPRSTQSLQDQPPKAGSRQAFAC
jgi:hypothetical protein